MELKNRFQGIDFASLCSLAGRYDKPIPTRFLASMDRSKIPALMIRSEAESMKSADTIMETVSCHSFRKLSTAREMLLRINSLCTRKKVKLIKAKWSTSQIVLLCVIKLVFIDNIFTSGAGRE
jgi:hypothetical protein